MRERGDERAETSVLRPERVVAELRELQALTGDAGGAQRVAFGDAWLAARAWLRVKLENLPVDVQQDEAGNVWATLQGERQEALVLGSHLDSVPGGGWLDGCLGVLAGLEVLRRIAAEAPPPVTVRLVDWTDEEGARFGRSLFGSSAVSGTLRAEEVQDLRDVDGVLLKDAARRCGIRIERLSEAALQRQHVAAYLELHIEQGPVLEALGAPLGVVLGTYGIERHRVAFTGQTAHAGSTPMDRRRDAFAAAARLALAVRDIAKREGGVGTVGSCVTHPGIPTAVAGTCEITVDLRHMGSTALARMLAAAQRAGQTIAEEEDVAVAWSRIWRLDPVAFDEDLTGLAEEAVRRVAGTAPLLPSGPLHDAAEMARAGVPTAMVFVQSLHGLSHTREEDTREEHLLIGVRALDDLASRTMRRMAPGY